MNHYIRLYKALAELNRMVANMVRVGVVEDVKGNKVKMNFGKGSDGKPVLSPWINPANTMFGEARHRTAWRKGQNAIFIAPGGDPNQAMALPGGPNKDNLPPDHANKEGKGEETFQIGDLRVRKKNDRYSIWMQSPRQQQQQGELKELPQYDSDASADSASAILTIARNGNVTGRVKDMRFHANEKGVKLKAGKGDSAMFAVVTKDKLICSKEWEIDKDPIDDDDDI